MNSSENTEPRDEREQASEPRDEREHVAEPGADRERTPETDAVHDRTSASDVDREHPSEPRVDREHASETDAVRDRTSESEADRERTSENDAERDRSSESDADRERTSENDAERERPSGTGAEHRTRSTSRDLDAIASRLAGARPADSGASGPAEGRTTDSGRTRDAARIRSLIDRSPDGEFVAAARGYASALPAGFASTPVDVPSSQSPAAAAPDPLRFPRHDELEDRARPAVSPRPRLLARGIAVGVTATVGMIIALGAYAGGGELISKLIDGDSELRPAEEPIDANVAPLVIVDSAVSASDSIAEAEQLATFGEMLNDTIRRAPFGSGRIVALPSARKPRLGDTLRPGISPVAPVPTVRTPASASIPDVPANRESATSKSEAKAVGTAATAKNPAKTPNDGAKPAPSSRSAASPAPTKGDRSYRVQIRATPDRSEADRLARQLRSRGAKDVIVTQSTKEGKTIFRVRYGTFSSADEAQKTARRDGHANAWIVPR